MVLSVPQATVMVISPEGPSSKDPGHLPRCAVWARSWPWLLCVPIWSSTETTQPPFPTSAQTQSRQEQCCQTAGHKNTTFVPEKMWVCGHLTTEVALANSSLLPGGQLVVPSGQTGEAWLGSGCEPGTLEKAPLPAAPSVLSRTLPTCRPGTGAARASCGVHFGKCTVTPRRKSGPRGEAEKHLCGQTFLIPQDTEASKSVGVASGQRRHAHWGCATGCESIRRASLPSEVSLRAALGGSGCAGSPTFRCVWNQTFAQVHRLLPPPVWRSRGRRCV